MLSRNLYTVHVKKAIAITGAVFLFVGARFMLFYSYIYNAKQRNGEIPKPYRATLTEKYSCLTYKKLQGDLCKLGINTDVGEEYAVDFNISSGIPPALKNGDRFSASGQITPLQYLSTDYWDRFAIEGIFSVTDSFKKL